MKRKKNGKNEMQMKKRINKQTKKKITRVICCYCCFFAAILVFNAVSVLRNCNHLNAAVFNSILDAVLYRKKIKLK